MKTTTLRLPDDLYDKIWQIHTETRESINSIIVGVIALGLVNDYSEYKKFREERDRALDKSLGEMGNKI